MRSEKAFGSYSDDLVQEGAGAVADMEPIRELTGRELRSLIAQFLGRGGSIGINTGCYILT